MFENLLGQNAAGQLIKDIEAAELAPAVLFSGPLSSGKGTAALELGRVISCEAKTSAPDARKAAWNCQCPACSRHRLLVHPDLICLGSRQFSAEIAASCAAFLRETGNPAARLLFVRSVRKLLLRFNPLLWEDEPKGKKAAPLIDSLREDLDEFEALTSPDSEQNSAKQNPVVKLSEGILKDSFALESEGIAEAVPIAQIRRAASWCHLAPMGIGKLLIIENADRMQEEARNSLLKLLEEPPPRVNLVLSSSRPGSLIPTILSRLRPYRFAARSAETETEVIRRVFRDEAGGKSIGAYLDSYLPVSGETLEALAAFFAASVAYKAAMLYKKAGGAISNEVILLGKYCAPKAEAAGLGRPQGEAAEVLALVLDKAEKFEIRSLFSRFLYGLLEFASLSQRNTLPCPSYNEIWRKHTLWAETSAGLYNLRPAQVLEKLFTDLSRGLAEL